VFLDRNAKTFEARPGFENSKSPALEEKSSNVSAVFVIVDDQR
jgi:hypothetical protein